MATTSITTAEDRLLRAERAVESFGREAIVIVFDDERSPAGRRIRTLSQS